MATTREVLPSSRQGVANANYDDEVNTAWTKWRRVEWVPSVDEYEAAKTMNDGSKKQRGRRLRVRDWRRRRTERRENQSSYEWSDRKCKTGLKGDLMLHEAKICKDDMYVKNDESVATMDLPYR
ncbi:hypothetical protein L915_21557 [Phytophthora nicotianae]|uniref:Uncharacterized protein n=2 Tax=Phytophthora nicotianae TaxID=4792 RepID=W2FKH4_PHYNI|nr:hypothetical protein L915_21557 [Phytophthora nicotianae]